MARTGTEDEVAVRVNYAVVFVSDMKRAVSFYRDLLGVPVRFESPGWTEFATGGATLALHVAGGTVAQVEALQHLPAGRCRPGLGVPRLDAFHARMVERGVPCRQPPRETFGARVAEYSDPDGLAISVGEHPPAQAASPATRALVHAEAFPVGTERLFALLHTPSAIRAWWGVARAVVLAQPGGMWAAAWGGSEDDPEYVTAATIRTFDPPRRMVLTDYRYRARSGPLPFEADFATEFVVTADPQGAVLRVSQDGFPIGPEGEKFRAACARGWQDTFAGIRRFLSESAGVAG
ncbi:MAG: VOC family protein [Candidatus Polarisedimenticolia bacterium]